MKSVIQNYSTGKLKVVETPPPQPRSGWVLVRTIYSLISAGTEKTKVDTGSMSLLGNSADFINFHEVLTNNVGRVMRALRAVRAILRTPARFDRQQLAQLNTGRSEVRAVHRLGGERQIQ